MKRTFLITIVFNLIALFNISCKDGNSLSKKDNDISENIEINKPTNDSIAIMMAFKNAKSEKKFIKDLGLENEDHFRWNDDLIQIFRGDLDGNSSEDALLFFSIEGRDGGNNWDAHYALFINQNNQWKYISQINAGGDFAEYILFLNKIESGKITGNYLSNKDESLPEIPVEYVFRNGALINIYTGLHKTSNEEREYLSITEIRTTENVSIPLLGTLKEYQKLLGKGKISRPKEQPECGTYFDEGIISYLEYPKLKFEVNDKNRAAWITVEMPNSGIRVQTDKGTITEKTTLEELKSIFYKTDSWDITEMDRETQVFIIPDGMESDNQLHIIFDKNGKLISLSLFVMC